MAAEVGQIIIFVGFTGLMGDKLLYLITLQVSISALAKTSVLIFLKRRMSVLVLYSAMVFMQRRTFLHAHYFCIHNKFP